MKEACYSAAAALDYAKLHVEKRPSSKVLVIARILSQVRWPGEPTQGWSSGYAHRQITHGFLILMKIMCCLGRARYYGPLATKFYNAVCQWSIFYSAIFDSLET